jgi:hypothetical protein
MLSKNMITYCLIMLTMLLFVSYGGVIDFNNNASHGFMRNVYEMLKPDFPQAAVYGWYWNIILGIPYIIFMLYFFRTADYKSFEFITVITFILVYGFIYANGRFREPLMPILFLWLAKRKII